MSDLLKRYERFVEDNWHGDDPQKPGYNYYKDLFLMTSGLMGETGEVIDAIKKEVRDNVDKHLDIKKELGDVLYYLTKNAHNYGYSLEDIILGNIEKLTERHQLHNNKGLQDAERNSAVC